MSRKPGYRIYFVRDAGGLLTGRLMQRCADSSHLVATGRSEEQVLAQLEPLVEDALERRPELHGDLTWAEEIEMATVKVEIRPEVTVGKRTVLGKGRIPIEISFAWTALTAEKPGDAPAGYRVMLPRFGWSLVLEELGMASEVLRSAIGNALSGESQRSLFEFREAAAEYVTPWLPKSRQRRHGRRTGDDERFNQLKQVAEDWVEMARAGKLGAHFGPSDAERYAELQGMGQLPSLLLVGASGVGKTEWVRDFARHLARAARSEDETKLWATSSERILAGMKYLGMWEQRCLDLVSELEGEGHCLFVDRAWAFVQTRTGGTSIADLFQPAVSANRLSVIAECTEEEYERIQVKAPAFVSALRVLRLEEMASEAAARLVEEVVARGGPAERLHPEATRRLVRHLGLFRKDHAFPGKALVFLKWLEQRRKKPRPGTEPPGAAAPSVEDRGPAPQDGEPGPPRAPESQPAAPGPSRAPESQPATGNANHEAGHGQDDGEQGPLASGLVSGLAGGRPPQDAGRAPDHLRRRLLDARDIDHLFCQYSGLAEKLVSDEELMPPEALARELARGVVGQREPCLLAAKVLTRFKAGIGDPDKPMGSLLFVGPTGVGKTELAKMLARFVFGSEARLIRLDMSEYMLAGGVHRLLSDERGSESLVQRVSLQPLSVVLLDEIEKAHPIVFDALLAMLGEGRLTTSSGRLVDFRMALIVMTSNLGTGVMRVGFGSDRREEAAAAAQAAVRSHFRPEFFNRLDHVVPFGSLTEADLRQIVDLELAKIRERQGLRRRRLSLVVTDEAKAHLAKVGWHPSYGARPLRRVIEERVITPIAIELARRPKRSATRVLVDAVKGAIEVRFGGEIAGGSG